NQINSDPQFTDTGRGDYRLQITSPAINKGDNASWPSRSSTDLAGNTRIFDDTVDIGAYEYQGIIPDINGIVYVDSTIVTPGKGNSWNKAMRYLSTAIKEADRDSAVKEIHV